MLKCVIFDMDGVIIDSEPLHMEAVVETLKVFDITPEDGYLEQFVGTTARHMYHTLIQTYNIPVLLEDMLSIDEKKCSEVYERRGMPMVEGIKELVHLLYKQGIKLGIASSSPIKRIELVTKKFGISKYFDKLISGAELANPKPAPDIFLKALKELGESEKETIIIEDSKNGCLAAKSANITCIGFLNPNSYHQDLYAADAAFTSMQGLTIKFMEDVITRKQGLPIEICNTKRLLIRELTVNDIRDLYTIYQNKDVTKYIDSMDELAEMELEKHKAYIRNVYAFYGYGLWGIYSKTTKALIGRCGIENKIIDGKQEIELSYLLDQPHWGYGYALECCKAVLLYASIELSIPRIVAVIDALNVRSIHVAKNLGLILEKPIRYHHRNCLLYTIDLALYREKATKNAARKYQEHQDTSVYKKHN